MFCAAAAQEVDGRKVDIRLSSRVVSVVLASPDLCVLLSDRSTEKKAQDKIVSDSAWMGSTLSSSPDRRLVVYPCREGDLLNVVAIHPTGPEEVKEASWLDSGNLDQLLETYSSFGPELQELCRMAEDLKLWSLASRSPPTTFVQGKLALAFEDGAALGGVLPADTTLDQVPQRLSLYDKVRYDRAVTVMMMSKTHDERRAETLDELRNFEGHPRLYLSRGSTNSALQTPLPGITARDIDKGLLNLPESDDGGGLGPSIWPNILDPRSSLDHFDNIWLASTEPTTGPIPAPETPQIPTPLTTATVGEIYNRACSPGPTDEAVEPRQYQPTAIEIDAQLTFPDMQHIRTEDVDKEHLAHIHEIQQNVVDEVAKLASVLESKSLFPPFVKLKIPPAPIINAWTQLYFEHFHPVFPVLHKPTYRGPDTHWLLVFAVSAIGAQFSRIPQAQTCARAMHELIRRQSMYLLVDSAFQSHFDLTPVLSVGELQNSLPHGEERWAASGARGWASFSTHTESSTLHTVEQVVRDSTWMASWIKTGILGKQTLLQLLSNAAVIDQDRLLSSQSHNGISQIEAEAALKALLAGTEDEESNVSALELKASISHRLVILSVLMLRNTPRLPLLATAMRVRYRRYTDEELRSLATEWNKAPQERRRAAVYAARAFESVRSQYCAHFLTPVLLFRATLIIWLFTVLDDLSLDSQPASDAPLIILGASNTTDPNQEQWVESGNGRVKLQGVGNIFSSLGRQRFLDESISAMQSLRSWGISRIYRQLLTQLRAD
ncbi:uncharacterized protein N7498_009109 [Penicillium cinerascens]|uniref:Xylanolytic transcriptional activator regulatory domain-containing protein n=1 Tax=Penicillium cinerascens TaxID=70096 RepID=A0A9W9J3U6_9EURO|nr:uncharacterized protein N7498_009109 [Penicillium cinerascens]KAJ5190124.1 hypothetical protein N7498_009109 [Penicillium cinerascens]